MSQAELAAFVQSHLRTKEIDMVLSGDAPVAIYSNYKYTSLDVDLIDIQHTKRSVLREAMREIGFQEEGRHFQHPDTQFFIEFPPGPLAIGSEPITQINELEFSTGRLRIISPTDCVKDRLAGYYHWSDLQCLEQAILVAQSNEIDMARIEKWSEAEGRNINFQHIRERLTQNR